MDAVLISHNHYADLDETTGLAVAAQHGGSPLCIVPLGVESWMTARGIRSVQQMDWWDRTELTGRYGRVSVHFVPSHHWSSRTPWDRGASLWGSFVVETTMGEETARLYYAGDTGYAPDFAEIGRRFGGFDLSMIPVCCYLPRWFMLRPHVNEEEAIRIHNDVGSRRSIGVHWRTFRLCDDPIDAPVDGLPSELARLSIPENIFNLPNLVRPSS